MASFTKITGIKFIELVVAIVLFIYVFIDGTTGYSSPDWHYGTYQSYLIILIGVVGGAMTGTPVNRRIDLLFTVIGAVLFIIVGITVFTHSSNKTSNTIKGVLAIVEGVLFVFDGFFTFRGDA